MIDYEIVIPAFNCADELKQLFEDIHETCDRYKPKRIIVVDDASDDDETKYVGNIYHSRHFPVKTLVVNQHKGPFYAEKLGLDSVQSEFAIVLHSDTRLNVKIEVPDRLKPIWRRDLFIKLSKRLISDTLSVLASYISQVENAAVVTCYSLDDRKTVKVSRGRRALGINKIPYSHYMEANFFTLKQADRFYNWQYIYSMDSNIYAVRTKVYKEIGFDELFAPYWLYHDDFCARARQAGYQSYLTQDVVAFHPLTKRKHPASLAIIIPDVYFTQSQHFIDRYDESALWTEASFGIKTHTTEEI